MPNPTPWTTNCEGPTATLAYRRLGVLASEHPDGVEVYLPELATSLGVSESLTRNAPLPRALQRLMRFGAAELREDAFAVRRKLAR